MIKRFRLLWGLVCLVVGGCHILHAQNEGNIWYFGEYAGLDFNGGAPVALTDGAMNAHEGCATICDQSGNLLFYTNGAKVWNKNHIVMSNGGGLTGNPSSTQSATIVKKPGSNSVYMVFTIGGSLRYSEVDMTLDGGLGAVNSNKNIPIVAPVCEKIAAVRHRNGVDFWIIALLFGSNTFHSYLLTTSGLNDIPVVSNVGIIVSGPPDNTIGYMKASSDGTRVAVLHSYLNGVELLDFDNSTGILNNPITFTEFDWLEDPYGVEFSPNGNLLYISFSSYQSPIYQYNLLAGSPTEIVNSKTAIGDSYSIKEALQLGPDNKIYCAKAYHYHLAVIHNPNGIGLSCNYEENGVSLDGKRSMWGLPTFYNNVTNPYTVYSNHFCMGEVTEFEVTPATLIDSVSWNFNDASSGSNNTSSMVNPQHQFSDTGRYTVTLVIDAFGISDTLYHDVYISPSPYIPFGEDTTLCEGEIMLLDATTPNGSYLWQDGSTLSSMLVSEPGGEYSVEVTVNDCSTSDTIVVDYNPLPIVNIREDTSLCAGETILLDATNANASASYEWQDGSTNATLHAAEPGGLYSVEVTVNGCTSSDVVEIEYLYAPDIDLGDDSVLCVGETILLDVTTPEASYLWSNGTTNASIAVQEPAGQYWVHVASPCGVDSDTVYFEYEDCYCGFYIPNAFTPNDDGINDWFTPLHTCDPTKYQLQVFNRWGEMVFITHNPSEGWDGFYKGKPAAPGAYAIVVSYLFDGDRYMNSEKGSITLIR